MKRSGIVLALLAVSLVAGTSVAGPPLDGVYQSTDLSGPVDLGRYSESFVAPDGALDVGTTMNAQSWDGFDLGLQWRYYCGTQVTAPVLLTDNVNAEGNGNRTYMKTFMGGYIWLSGAGPWANGDAEYTGPIISYVEFETITYDEWDRVAAITNVQATANFDGYPTLCMNFAIGNGSEVGSTDFGDTKPATYPDFLEEGTCDPVMVYGSWWDMFTLTLTITGCTTPTQDATWGDVKSRYSE